MENNAVQLLFKEKVPETGNYGVLGQILDASQLLEQISPRTCSWDGTSVAAAWTLADLKLGPQAGFCARKPPTSPGDLGSGLQAAYCLAPYACAVHLFFPPQALRFGTQASWRDLSGDELLHCESDGGVLCGGVGVGDRRIGVALWGGLSQTPPKGTWKERPQHHGANRRFSSPDSADPVELPVSPSFFWEEC